MIIYHQPSLGRVLARRDILFLYMLIYSKSLFLGNPLLAAKLICYFIVYFKSYFHRFDLFVEGNVISWPNLLHTKFEIIVSF